MSLGLPEGGVLRASTSDPASLTPCWDVACTDVVEDGRRFSAQSAGRYELRTRPAVDEQLPRCDEAGVMTSRVELQASPLIGW